MTRIFVSVAIFVGALGLAGCCGSDKSSDSSSGKPTEGASAKKAKEKAKGALNNQKPKISAAAKWMEIPGTNTAFEVPEGWESKTEGNLAVAGSKNDKAGLVATTYTKGTDPTPLLGRLAGALSLKECEWSNIQDVTIGKDDVPAKVADGACMQDGKVEYVMYAMVNGSDINAFVLTGWDEDAPQADQDAATNMILSLKVEDEKK